MKRLMLPLLFGLIFVFEGIFAQFLPADLFGGEYIFVPRFLIIAVLFLTVYGGKKHGILYGFLFGLLYDLVYTEVIGIYLFIVPLAAYMMWNIMRIVDSHPVMVSIVSILFTGLVEIAVYFMNLLIHIATIGFMTFVQVRMVPTLLMNLIFIILFCYPFKVLFERFADSIKSD